MPPAPAAAPTLPTLLAGRALQGVAPAPAPCSPAPPSAPCCLPTTVGAPSGCRSRPALRRSSPPASCSAACLTGSAGARCVPVRAGRGGGPGANGVRPFPGVPGLRGGGRAPPAARKPRRPRGRLRGLLGHRARLRRRQRRDAAVSACRVTSLRGLAAATASAPWRPCISRTVHQNRKEQEAHAALHPSHNPACPGGRSGSRRGGDSPGKGRRPTGSLRQPGRQHGNTCHVESIVSHQRPGTRP